MPEFDWSAVQRAAVTWQQANGATRPDFLYVPTDTDPAILEMAGEIYDVIAKRWPVKAPSFGSTPPFDRAVPDRDVESTMDVLNGAAPNTRGLPFPLHTDIRQRDWQFQFCSPEEALLRARWIYDTAEHTLMQLLLWALVQNSSPHASPHDLADRWLNLNGYSMGGMVMQRIEQMQIEDRRANSRNPNQRTVGQLWIVTGSENVARTIISSDLARLAKPRLITPNILQSGKARGTQFGLDDRIFYQQWNPHMCLPELHRLGVPTGLLPVHQLDPFGTCTCLLCQQGGFDESTWWRIQQESHARDQQSGRMSRQSPAAQSLPRMTDMMLGDRQRFLADQGIIDIGVVEKMSDAEKSEHTMEALRQYLGMGAITREQALKLTDITEA